MSRSLLAQALLLVSSVAAAVPVPPGTPPSLAHVPEDGVVEVTEDKVRSVSVFLVGTDRWTLELRAGKTTYRLVLPKLAVGTFRGTADGLPWAVELTTVAPGYLKMPGPCAGKVAAWMTSTTYVVGTFKAGCLSYNQPPKP